MKQGERREKQGERRKKQSERREKQGERLKKLRERRLKLHERGLKFLKVNQSRIIKKIKKTLTLPLKLPKYNMSRSTVHYADNKTNNALKKLHNKLRPAGTPVQRVEYIIELLLLRIFETKIKQDDEFKPLRKLFSTDYRWKKS